ncbi:hypothetical protein BH09SUM1_BH09SUM1_04790 [soil metagenome]
MRKSFIAFVTGSIAIAAIITAYSAGHADAAGVAGGTVFTSLKPGEDSDQKATSISTPTIHDLGASRSIYVGISNVDGTGASHSFTAGEEINVSTFTVLTYVTGTNKAFTANMYLKQNPIGGVGNAYPVNVLSTGEGTQHFTYDPPIPIRAGDTLSFFPSAAPASGQSLRYEISITGTNPASKSTAFITQ